jgi:hypothetical protein
MWWRLHGERSLPVWAMPMIGPARLELVEADPEVHVALEIERGHVGVRRIVEPGAGTKLAWRSAGIVGHCGLVSPWDRALISQTIGKK